MQMYGVSIIGIGLGRRDLAFRYLALGKIVGTAAKRYTPYVPHGKAMLGHGVTSRSTVFWGVLHRMRPLRLG